ncbi:Bug family tripartite tricarboxylate transporter substrate binding protein [Comamonas testosteroni]|uniref:Bug family tripartite tricarboxylate transporter substrate binding protein n=1 Tax=Comamonas testosteroni TaxID=285 RepID=UPI0015F8D1A0|nr:tripartite tricarboxylate transporter substrate binding protein [Comamonas testosteroni]
MSSITRRSFAWGAAALLAGAPALSQAQAGSYPAGNTPIRIVVPYAAGGSSDFVARLLVRKMGDNMKHSFIVDNRPGGNTIIAAEHVSKAKPDGYTIYLIGELTHASLQALNKKLPFDPVKDFSGITNLVESPLVISVPKSFPASTLKEFVDYAKAHPAEVNFGSAGLGNTLHLAGENFSGQTGVQLNHVQYKGASQAILDLLAGRIQVMFDLPQTPLPHIQAGKLKALAVTSAQRLPMLPAVPTTTEAGFPSYRFVTRIGVAAPGGTPQPILDKLYAEISKVVADPEFRTAVEGQAMFPAPSASPAAYQKRLQDSMATVGELLRGANVQPQ